MADCDALVTPSSRHVLPRQLVDAGTNNPPTTRKEGEPAARESCLPEEYRSFVERSKEKDLLRKEAQEAAAKHEEKLERAKLDHEKDMWHLKLEFRIQVDGLMREKKELQSTIHACGKLFGEMRDEHKTEIETLTHTMERLQSEVNAKAKELKVMYDAYDEQVKVLEHERAELPTKLAKAAKEALALQSNAKPTNEAVAAKAAASVPAHLKGKSQRFAHCSQCMRHNWDCDGGARCMNCSLRGITKGCKRVACRYYNKGMCKNENCRFAHAGDGYKNIVSYEAVWGDGRELSPVELQTKGHKGGWKAAWS